MPTPTKFEDFNGDVFAFNDKYKLNFSFEQFEKEVVKLNKSKISSEELQINPISNADSVYQDTYQKLYKQATNNVIDKKISPFEYSTLLDDFEKLMNRYRTVSTDDRTTPTKRGGWTKESDVIKSAQKKLYEIHDNKQTDVEERYKRGEIRIRDMRGYAKELADVKEDSVEKLSVLLNYANALENVNKNRPFRWRVFNLIRNSAEKRYAEKIRNTAKKLLGPNLSAAEALLSQQTAPNLKSNMDELLTQAIANESELTVSRDSTVETVIQTGNISKEDSDLNKSVNEVAKDFSDDMKPEPISVKFDDVSEANNKSLADMTAEERAQKLYKSDSFKKEMIKEVMNCLKDSRLNEDVKRSRAANIYNGLMEYCIDSVCVGYDFSVESGDSPDNIDSTMQNYANLMFENAYGVLQGCKIPSEKKLLVAQKLSNLFLTKATPVGFYPKKFAKYSENFAIHNRDNVIQQMKSDTEYTINSAFYNKFIDETMKELNVRERFTIENAKKTFADTEPTQPKYSIADIEAINLDDVPEEEVQNFFSRK